MSKFTPKHCSMCGEMFTPTSGVQIHCEKCKEIARIETSRRFRKNQKERMKDTKCCLCGGDFGEMIEGKPYCHKHRSRYRKYHTFDLPDKVSTSTFEIKGDELLVTTKSNETILCDADDFGKVKDFSWYVSSSGYAATTDNGMLMYMHRLIKKDELQADEEVDHINGNPLDNRKVNLRVCSHKENLRNLGVQKNNTSGYPGVHKLKSGRFRALIMIDYRSIDLGTYATFEEAVAARKDAEKLYFGEFARDKK